MTFLERYHKEGDQFLDHIVSDDQTWTAHITPDSKQQSLQCRCTGCSKLNAVGAENSG